MLLDLPFNHPLEWPLCSFITVLSFVIIILSYSLSYALYLPLSSSSFLIFVFTTSQNYSLSHHFFSSLVILCFMLLTYYQSSYSCEFGFVHQISLIHCIMKRHFMTIFLFRYFHHKVKTFFKIYKYEAINGNMKTIKHEAADGDKETIKRSFGWEWWEVQWDIWIYRYKLWMSTSPSIYFLNPELYL